MATLSTNLSGKWGTLRIKKEELEKLDTRLAEELIRLEGERQAQQDLFDEMMGERAVFGSDARICRSKRGRER